MYARMATFTVNDSSTAEEIGPKIREVAVPIVRSMAGWQGGIQMLDRESGKLAVIHYFDTKESMDAAESTFESMPQQFPEALRNQMQQAMGGRQSVERFEVLSEMSASG